MARTDEGEHNRGKPDALADIHMYNESNARGCNKQTNPDMLRNMRVSTDHTHAKIEERARMQQPKKKRNRTCGEICEFLQTTHTKATRLVKHEPLGVQLTAAKTAPVENIKRPKS